MGSRVSSHLVPDFLLNSSPALFSIPTPDDDDGDDRDDDPYFVVVFSRATSQ